MPRTAARSCAGGPLWRPVLRLASHAVHRRLGLGCPRDDRSAVLLPSPGALAASRSAGVAGPAAAVPAVAGRRCAGATGPVMGAAEGWRTAGVRRHDQWIGKDRSERGRYARGRARCFPPVGPAAGDRFAGGGLRPLCWGGPRRRAPRVRGGEDRRKPPSSSGPGHRPFKAAARVRIPLGALLAGVACSTWSCRAARSARHPVKVEVAGSNPVRTAQTGEVPGTVR